MARDYPSSRQKRIDLAQLGQSGDIAVLVADGFHAPDLTSIASLAEHAGYRTQIISPNKSLVSGSSETGEEMNFVVDQAPGEKAADRFAGLLLPGGADHLDRLLADQDTRLLLKDVLASGRAICALGDAVAVLAEAAGKPGVSGDAALALKGDVFASGGETAREDAAALFVKTLTPVKAAA